MVRFLEAVLILSGMIIGTGMFGLPFSFFRAGFWLGVLELVLLSGVVLLIYFLYAEVILGTRQKHRLPGYASEHIGPWAKNIGIFSIFFGMSGSLLAYLLLGSNFLKTIFGGVLKNGGGSEFFWVILLVLGTAMITLFSLKKEALVNGILTAFLIGFIIFLAAILFPKIEISNLGGFDFSKAGQPYGIILFALLGGVVIPDLIDRLGRKPKQVRAAIAIGTLLPAFLYFFFVLAVVGVSGISVSQDAISGLEEVAGKQIIFWGSLIGFLAVFTSLIALSTAFQGFLRIDLKISRISAWVAAFTLPFLLYMAGLKNFISVMAAVGAIAGGIDILLILLAHHKLRKKQGIEVSLFSYVWKFALFAIIIAGMLYEIVVL